jgi:hypothetical protein
VLKIHEVTGVDGELSGIYLRLAGDGRDGLELVEQSGVMAVPEGALEIVMKRYGAPYDDQARVTAVAELELGEGRKLRHVRHLAGYDVVQRDYLVLERPGNESLCAPGTTVAGALQHLARAAARK